ncbi:hypothetical protein QQ045_021654 [Rhodiola kirilowii]
MPSCCVINQHAHLVVEMIYINLLACQTHKACYVAFWDEITLATQSHNDRISEDHIISKWRIVVVRELPFLDQRLNVSNYFHKQGTLSELIRNPISRKILWVFWKCYFVTNSELAISEYGARSNFSDEGVAVVKKHKATPEEVKMQ